MNFQTGSLIFVVALLGTAIASANQIDSENIKGNKKKTSAKVSTIDTKVEKFPSGTKSKKSAAKSFHTSYDLPHKTGKTFRNQDLPSQRSGQGLLVRRQFIPNLIRRYQFLQQQYMNQPSDERQSQAFYSNEERDSESKWARS